MEQMNDERQKAQKKYDDTLVKLRNAETGTDMATYLKAEEDHKNATKILIAMELMYPTIKERKRKNRILYLGNRGFQI